MNRNTTTAVLSRGIRICLLFAGITVLSACATDAGMLKKGSQNNPVKLTITWKADACLVDTITPDASLCEDTFPEFCIPRTKWVEWHSTPPKKYVIYFSPFNKGSLKAEHNGIAKGKIDDDAPYAVYKYTIVADGCDPETKSNDPGIRVNK